MGDYADMMLDGTCCEGCGEFINADPRGYPSYCSKTCAENRGADWFESDDIEETFTDEDIENDKPKRTTTRRNKRKSRGSKKI